MQQAEEARAQESWAMQDWQQKQRLNTNGADMFSSALATASPEWFNVDLADFRGEWLKRIKSWCHRAATSEGMDEDYELQQMRSAWEERRLALEQQGDGAFIDHKFPPDASSLGSAVRRVPGSIWLRPSELFHGKHCVLREASLAETPGWSLSEMLGNANAENLKKSGRSSSLVAQELSKNINQGLLGDCWLLSAMSVLCTRPTLLEKLFLDPPAASPSGAYCFRLFEDGKAKPVIVDDCIPASQMGRQPVFARPHTGSHGEVVLWPLLLEKAFAKMYGSYGAIEAGQVHEALMDMTGGLGEIIGLRGHMGAATNADNLWARLWHLKRAGHLLTAGSDGSYDMHTSPRGIVQGHAYSIMQVRTLPGGLRLLKLRNPWGCGEWRGDFGNGSRCWTPELRAKLRYAGENDGVIWMPFRDFMTEFACIYICRIFKSDEFHRQVLHGNWAKQPKQSIPLRVEEGDGCVCLQLQQGDVRGLMGAGSPIRLEVIEAHSDDQKKPLKSKAWRKCTPVTPEREVALDVELRKGDYDVIVQVCNFKGGRFALIAFSPQAMKVTLKPPDETFDATTEHCSDDFGLSTGDKPNVGMHGPPMVGFQTSGSTMPQSMGFFQPAMPTQPQAPTSGIIQRNASGTMLGGSGSSFGFGRSATDMWQGAREKFPSWGNIPVGPTLSLPQQSPWLEMTSRLAPGPCPSPPSQGFGATLTPWTTLPAASQQGSASRQDFARGGFGIGSRAQSGGNGDFGL